MAAILTLLLFLAVSWFLLEMTDTAKLEARAYRWAQKLGEKLTGKTSLDDEMRMWEEASIQDLLNFERKENGQEAPHHENHD